TSRTSPWCPANRRRSFPVAASHRRTVRSASTVTTVRLSAEKRTGSSPVPPPSRRGNPPPGAPPRRREQRAAPPRAGRPPPARGQRGERAAVRREGHRRAGVTPLPSPPREPAQLLPRHRLPQDDRPELLRLRTPDHAGHQPAVRRIGDRGEGRRHPRDRDCPT